MQKKIKILFRHRSMEMGGVEKVLLSILNALDKNRYECTVCLNLNQGELRNEFPSHVRKVFLTQGKEDFSKNKYIQKIQLAKRHFKLKDYYKNPYKIDQLLGERYDIEIAMSYAGFTPVLSSTNPNSKKIAWFHSEINVPKFQPLVPLVLDSFPKFDQIVYCSQKIKDMMHHYYPDLKYPRERVIINAIPIEEIKQKATQEIESLPEVPVFCSIGRLHTRKGYHKLIEAHKKLIDEGFNHHVMVLGDGEEMTHLKKQVADCNVASTFTLCGNKMNPYPYMKNADFFIMPSESEAWPLVIAEALILQKPIIATDTGDVGLMIKKDQTGCLISYDTEEIYLAMKRFLTDKGYVESLRKNLQTIEDQFDNKKIFDEIEDVFHQLLY